MDRIDCRGITGSEPVLLVEKALRESGNESIAILVDNDDSLQSIKELAKIHNREVDIIEIEKANEIIIHPAVVADASGYNRQPFTVFITSDRLGTGNDELGSILIKAFLNTLWEGDVPPTKIVFMNAGVRLTIENSHVLDTLGLLAEDGVEILTCGTCLGL